MKSPALLRYALREMPAGARALGFFVGCLALGVAAVVAVDALSSGIEAGVRAHARELLGGDAVLQSWRPLPELGALAPGVDTTLIKEMVTMASRAEGRSQLVELRVVDARYPFYGPPRLDPDRPLGDLLTAETTVVADELLDRLSLKVGDALRLGGQDFRISGRVLSEADTVSGALRLGPRVFLSAEGFARTPLETFGSRIMRRALFKVPADAGLDGAERLVAALKARFKERDDLRIETFRDVQPAVKRTMERMEPFLALVALVALLLGGIGVGQGVRVFLRGRMDTIAILRALGVRPREVLLLYVGEIVALTLAGSAIGVLLGLAVPLAAPQLLGDALPPGLLRPSVLGPALRGLLAGLAVAALFAVGPLLSAVRVPPARVLRRDAEPLPWPRGVRVGGGALLLVAVAAVAASLAQSIVQGATFAGGLAVVALVVALAMRGLVIVAGALARRGPLAVRYGAAGVARPGADTLAAMVALGIGLTLVVALQAVERHLALDLGRDLPHDAPTAFLVDVQPDQWPKVEGVLRDAGATEIDSVPVVTGRLRSIDGRRAMEIARERAPDQRSSLSREQRLTYLAALPKGNTLAAGRLWSDPQRAEISLEERFAGELSVGLGSVLTFDIQGVPIDLVVTSLRRVDWRTFGINFFAIAEPGALDEAPQMRLAAARLPAADEHKIQDQLAAAFPNVTVVLVREVLLKVSAVVTKLAAGVQLLGGFTFAAGLGILAAAFHMAARRRAREVALLKTLGMTRRQVLAAFAVEYTLVGLSAAIVGTAGGSLIAWGVVRHLLDMEWDAALWPAAVAALQGTLVTVLASLAASTQALRARPAAALS